MDVIFETECHHCMFSITRDGEGRAGEEQVMCIPRAASRGVHAVMQRSIGYRLPGSIDRLQAELSRTVAINGSDRWQQ
jgi:hypothetical protein